MFVRIRLDKPIEHLAVTSVVRPAALPKELRAVFQENIQVGIHRFVDRPRSERAPEHQEGFLFGIQPEGLLGLALGKSRIGNATAHRIAGKDDLLPWENLLPIPRMPRR